MVSERKRDSIDAFLIDYGENISIPLNDVRPLPLELIRHPPMAFQCQLSGKTAGSFIGDYSGNGRILPDDAAMYRRFMNVIFDFWTLVLEVLSSSICSLSSVSCVLPSDFSFFGQT